MATPLALDPMRVLFAMGVGPVTPPATPKARTRSRRLSNRDRQTPPARVRTPKASLRAPSQSRPGTAKATGAEMMRLIDVLVESMPKEHQAMCVRVMSRMEPQHRRVFTETLSDHVTDADRQLRAFQCCDSLLTQYGPQSCAALVASFQDDPAEAATIIDLHPCFVESRWKELPELNREKRTELINLFRLMTHAEQKKVGRACGKLLPMTRVLQLLNHLPEKHCPLCRIKRLYAEQYLLEQGLEEDTSQNQLRLPFTPDVYAFEERDEDPSSDHASALRQLGLEDSDACVIFDKKGYNFRIDTARICPECRRGVYGVMAHLANDREYHHLTGKKKFKQLELRMANEKSRAAWWTAEKKRSLLHVAIQALNEVKEKVTTRAELKRRQAERRARQLLEDDALLAKEVARNAVVDYTRRIAEVMRAKDKDHQVKELARRDLYFRLQSEKEHCVNCEPRKERWRRSEVENNGISSRKREFSDDGVPLTAAAAASVFGLTPLVVRDETAELQALRREAADFELRSDRARAAFKEHADSIARREFSTDCEGWVHDALMVDDLKDKKLKQEQAAREARIKARDAEKLRLNKLRAEFRKDGMKRAADARKALDAVKRRRALGPKREAAERTQMSCQEADQKRVDMYWGIHLNYDRISRLEEMARLVYQMKLEVTNEVMRKTESIRPFYLDEKERKRPPSAAPVDPFAGRSPAHQALSCVVYNSQ